MTDDTRPKKRRKRFMVYIDEDVYERALKRARGNKNFLRAVLRAFMRVWGSGEYPDPPIEVIELESQRAKGGGRKPWKHKNPEPPPDGDE